MRRGGIQGLVEALTPVIAQADAELCDIERVKEHGATFLRITIDTEAGANLSDCERVHKLIVPMLEDVDFDYLEVSSPGLDRPLKRPRDFIKCLGKQVEVRLFHAPDGQRVFYGTLVGYDEEDRVSILPDGGGEVRGWPRKELALVKLSADEEIRKRMEGLS